MEDPCEKANDSLFEHLGLITPETVRHMTECSFSEKLGAVYREWVLRTLQGLEIDLSSCNSERAVQAIQKSALSLEKSRSCLYAVAPTIAMGAYLGIAGCDQGNALRVHCGHSANPDTWFGRGCLSVNGERMCDRSESHGGSGAASHEGFKTIVLTAYDPSVAQVRNAGQQKRLDSALFQEILHNADSHDQMEQNPRHNVQRLSVGTPDDHVYACQALCSPSRERFTFLSRERCITCAQAGDGDDEACAELPPEALGARIKALSAMDRCIEALRNELSPSELQKACEALDENPALPDGALSDSPEQRSIYGACLVDSPPGERNSKSRIQCIERARAKHKKGIGMELLTSEDGQKWIGYLSAYQLNEEGRPSLQGVSGEKREEELRYLIEAGAATLIWKEGGGKPNSPLVSRIEVEAELIGISTDPKVIKLLTVLKTEASTARTAACRKAYP